MWDPGAWTARSNARAIDNARAATTECARRRVERAEVELFLRGLAARDRPHTQPGPVEHHA